MQMIDLVGYTAASLTTLSFLPQAIKTIKTRDTSGISLAMYSMFAVGVFFWLIYGVLLQNLVIVIANVITLLLASVILIIKIKSVRKIRI